MAIAADGTMWTSLTERGELACVSPDRQVGKVSLGSAHSRPMVPALGPDAVVWFSRGTFPDGRIEEFALPDPSCRPHAIVTAADGGCWATSWSASSVVRLDRGGRLAGETRFRPGAEPHGLALASDGTLWVALETGSLAHLTA